MLSMQRYGGLEYRLGDLYYGKLEIKHIPVRYIFCKEWPGTIGCEYALRKRSIRDFTTLTNLIRDRTTAKPPNCTLVVHLRLGDVLDWDVYTNKYKCNIKKGCIWVHPISKYTNKILPNEICNIEILGNPYYRVSNGTISLLYMKMVYNTLKHVRPTKVIISKRVDSDFVYMCNSRFFMPSKGHFSKMITTVVKYNGGIIL